MPSEESASLSRRQVLRRGLGGTAALAVVGSSDAFGLGGGPEGTIVRSPAATTVGGNAASLRVTVHLAANAPTAHLEAHVRPALESIAVQAGVDAEIASVTSLSRSVSLHDDYQRILDRFADWSDDDAVDRREGHVNLLLYAQLPLLGTAYACDHRGVLAADEAPIAVCNADVELFWPPAAYRNTLITAIARPVLSGMVGKTLDNGEEVGTDLNSFGTVFDGDVPRSSPLATWHTPAGAGCIKPNNFEGEDLVETLCGHESTRPSCGYTTRLSECTRLAIRARLASL